MSGYVVTSRGVFLMRFGRIVEWRATPVHEKAPVFWKP